MAEKTQSDRVLIQWKVKPAVANFIKRRTEEGGYTRRNLYLLDLLKKDGLKVELSDL